MCHSILYIVSPLEIVIVGVVAALAVILPAVILWVVCKKRGGEF